jgi:putative phage-type endonuclease
MKKIDIDQRSPEWYQLRKTNITGTVLKGIMGTARARQEAIYEAIANRLTVGVDDEEDYENAMDRGIRLEPDAIAEFEFLTGKSVEKVGFCESEELEGVAQSPDGYIKDTDDTEAVEVKSMGGKNHIKLWLTNEVPDEYEWQVVQYFVVNDKLKKLYFVGYNPQIPTHPLHIIEVERDETKITKAKEAQKVFLQEIDAILQTIIKL